MITSLNQPYDAGNYYTNADELVGLSTDTKPVNVGNGTTLYEMDTGDKYMFDAEGATWNKIAATGGSGESGGGGSGGGVLVVTLDMQTRTLDKTWQEIYDSASAVITVVEQGEKSWLSVYTAYEYDGIYEVEVFAPGSGTFLYFVADSADGYPVMQQDGGD